MQIFNLKQIELLSFIMQANCDKNMCNLSFFEKKLF